MTHRDIEHIGWLYRKQGLFIIGFLFLIALLAVNISYYNTLLTPLYICTIYALVLEIAEAVVWTRIAKNSPDNLPNFFIAVSGIRILSAIVMMTVYYLVTGRETMLTFFFVFAVFYVAILIHHILFFRKHTDITINE